MNKNLVTVVVLLLLLGGGAYLMMNKGAVPAGTPNTQTPSTQTDGSTMKSLRNLMMAGVAQKCTFADADTSGTTFVSGGKVRTDFTTKTGETTTAGHMIVDNKTSYLWMDGQPTGFMMAFDPNETTNDTTTQNNSQQSVDTDKAMNYKCNPEVTNGSLFTPPSTVKFTDTSAAAAPTTGNQCAACAYLTGDDKAQCLSALKCN